MDTPQDNLLTDFEEPKFQYVGFWPRFGALFIDGIILMVFGYLITMVTNEETNLLLTIISGLTPILYHGILEFKYGATLGKMALGIKIVNYELQPPTINNILLRNLIYFAIQILSLSGDLYSALSNGNSTNPFEFYSNFDGLFTGAIILATIYLISLVVIYVVEIVFLVSDEKHRSLHDRIGKTYVVRNRY